jgi:hypothetical protein
LPNPGFGARILNSRRTGEVGRWNNTGDSRQVTRGEDTVLVAAIRLELVPVSRSRAMARAAQECSAHHAQGSRSLAEYRLLETVFHSANGENQSRCGWISIMVHAEIGVAAQPTQGEQCGFACV